MHTLEPSIFPDRRKGTQEQYNPKDQPKREVPICSYIWEPNIHGYCAFKASFVFNELTCFQGDLFFCRRLPIEIRNDRGFILGGGFSNYARRSLDIFFSLWGLLLRGVWQKDRVHDIRPLKFDPRSWEAYFAAIQSEDEFRVRPTKLNMMGDENGCPVMHQFAFEALVPKVMGSMSVHCYSIGSVIRTKERQCLPADRTSSSNRIEALEYTARASETLCMYVSIMYSVRRKWLSYFLLFVHLKD